MSDKGAKETQAPADPSARAAYEEKLERLMVRTMMSTIAFAQLGNGEGFDRAERARRLKELSDARKEQMSFLQDGLTAGGAGYTGDRLENATREFARLQALHNYTETQVPADKNAAPENESKEPR